MTNSVPSEISRLNERRNRVGHWNSSFLLPTLQQYRQKRFNLEIGCCHGHWLTSFAQAQSNKIFVGIDLISKRIHKAVSKSSKRKISNVLFLKAEANEFLDSLDSSVWINDTYIMYPDPWPKTRHYKRRLIQDSFLELLYSKTPVSGNLFFMTDHSSYFDWAYSKIKMSHLWDISAGEWPHDSPSYFSEILPCNNYFKATRV